MSVTKNKVLFSMALKTVTTAVFVLENLKCQQRPLKPVKSALYTTKFELGGGIAAKMGGRTGHIWSCPKKHPSF